jgi:hypothetical protein
MLHGSRRVGHEAREDSAMIFRRKEREPEVGDEVLTSDEEHLGEVAAVEAEALAVTGGTLDQRRTWRVPRAAIGKVDDQAVHLTLSRAQVLALG